MDAGVQLVRSHRTSTKVAAVLKKRIQTTNEKFARRVNEATAGQHVDPHATMVASMDPRNWYSYATDATQRAVLFRDTLWQRGNNFIENTARGLKPVLHFGYEIVLDGRTFERPVNSALLRITPPVGVTVDPALRPYLIIDPRAGHGPGIGGFKDDSQADFALRAGHPVYFVIFFRDPEPGRTLLDVCLAEQVFVKKVRELHPDSSTPAIIGIWQGGWTAMMLAASGPTIPDQSSSKAHRGPTGAAHGAKVRAATRCAMPAACSAGHGSHPSRPIWATAGRMARMSFTGVGLISAIPETLHAWMRRCDIQGPHDS
jgi:hypothetical protein